MELAVQTWIPVLVFCEQKNFFPSIGNLCQFAAHGKDSQDSSGPHTWVGRKHIIKANTKVHA